MSWLRLPEIERAIIERGHASTGAEAQEKIAAVVSRGRTPLTGHSGDARLNLPARPQIPTSVGYQWVVAPVLDFTASTILCPCKGSIPETWDEIKTRLRPTVVEIHSDDVDRIWPPRERSKGRPVEFDWDEAEQFAFKTLDEKGDPTNPLNHTTGWRSVQNLVGAIIEHLELELCAGNGPGRTTVQPRAAGWLREWRAAQTAGK